MTDLTQRARDVAARLNDGPYTVGPASGEIRELSEAAAIISELVGRIEGVWQDIETAPKDGEAVLLWSGEWIEPHIGYQALSGGKYRWFGDAGGCKGRLPNDKPTHWMPLPQPPSVLGKQEGEG
jgi:hypothetical protein